MTKRRTTPERLVKICEEQGFRTKRTRSGVMVFGKKGQGMVEIHLTPSDHRANLNSVARLRRIGVQL